MLSDHYAGSRAMTITLSECNYSGRATRAAQFYFGTVALFQFILPEQNYLLKRYFVSDGDKSHVGMEKPARYGFIVSLRDGDRGTYNRQICPDSRPQSHV